MMLLIGCATAATRQNLQLLRLRCFATSTGLFGIGQLRQPQDWRQLVETTKARCSHAIFFKTLIDARVSRRLTTGSI